MKRAIMLAACAVTSLSLSACIKGNTDPAAVLKVLGETYAHCDRVVIYQASIGALNPASGATVSGQVHCPPKVDPATPPGGT